MNAALFEGMEFYEAILMVSGCLLFLLSFVGLIVNMIRNAPLKVYIPLIVLSIIMIGYPGIQKVSFLNDMLNLEKYSREYKNDPSNEDLLGKISETYEKINPERIQSPEKLTTFAEAAILLEEDETAIRYATEALERNVAYQPAQQVLLMAETGILSYKVLENPENESLKSDLEEKLNHLENTPDTTVYKSLRIAEAQLVAGNTQKARQEASEIISKNPESAAARQIYDLANIQEKILQAERSQFSKDSLTEHLNNIESMSATSNQKALKLSIIAKVYSVLGDEQKVQEYHDSMRVYLKKPVNPKEYP